MARAGLGDGWECLFANDFSDMKARVYQDNWNSRELLVKDVNLVATSMLPGTADLVWASFPCQDLSLAGKYEGIGHRCSRSQTRSGTFWPFWKLMKNLSSEGRGPKLIVLENVYGTLTSNRGKDFNSIVSALSGANYKFGALVIDARHFVPQSRPRLFVIAVRKDILVPACLRLTTPCSLWHPKAMVDAVERSSEESKSKWIWWNLPHPDRKTARFSDIIEYKPTGVRWHTKEETSKLISLMSSVNLEKVKKAMASGKRVVGSIYKRTRLDGNGKKCQRAEVRFDDISGCLRTPSGGSSRQSIIVVEGKRVRTRLLSPREAARLMGLPDSYTLPKKYNDAYHVAGDGVVVPVVNHLAKEIILPLLKPEKEIWKEASLQAAQDPIKFPLGAVLQAKPVV